MGWHMGEWGSGWAWSPFGFGHLLWWGLLVVGIIALWRWGAASGRAGRSAADGPALRLLRERYARGEIDLEEFDERRKHLRG